MLGGMTRMMNVRLSIIILITGLFGFFGCSKPQDLSEPPKLVERATDVSDKGQVTNEPPDVLAATNIDQWKSLIPNLAMVADLPNQWMTLDRQKGVDSVVLKSKSQSIVYKTHRVSLMVANNAGEVIEADIYTPKIDIVETRELGLKICKMFGFDATKFDIWCKSVDNNWPDSPLIYVGDNHHNFKILHSYNDQQPWIMDFAIMPEKAYSDFMQQFDRQAQMKRPH
jgi:hypothetical protein